MPFELVIICLEHSMSDMPSTYAPMYAIYYVVCIPYSIRRTLYSEQYTVHGEHISKQCTLTVYYGYNILYYRSLYNRIII